MPDATLTPNEQVTVTIDTTHGHAWARERLLANLAGVPKLPDSALAAELVLNASDRPMPESVVYLVALREEAAARGLTRADLDQALTERESRPPVPPFPVAVGGVTSEADVARILHWLRLPPLATTQTRTPGQPEGGPAR